MKDDTRSASIIRCAANIEQAKEGSHDLNMAIARELWEELDCTYVDSDVPDFTGSLDAALLLVPEWREWRVGVDLENRKAWAEVGADVWDESFDWISVTAATLPLALCIAALKARSVASPQGEPREARESSPSSSEDR